MKRPHHTELLRLVLLSAVLVLGLALPRALVWCHHAGHGLRLEFAHAPGTCCEHDSKRAHAAPPCACGVMHDDERDGDHGSGVVRDGSACDHAAVHIELLPTPPSRTPALPPPGLLSACLQPPHFVLAAPIAVATTPPATGPPRPDPRVALRATTLLLL